ncbi:hypothetical protein ACTNBP_02765 [Oliverpabstia intestinalis]|uniref:hypothetical protein n=1 Tax=Oliverpabstia intestinalis TaxID=2606633 RepID=UPI003F89AE44
MKKFIMLSYTISRMGGGQMYQYNKLKFMKSRGYETFVFYAIPGKIVITDYENVSRYLCIEDINIFPGVLTRKQVNEVLERIKEYVGECDSETIIEACNKPTTLWGELLAERFGCTCFNFIIDERIGSLDTSIVDFFEHKRNMHELRGIKKETYEMIFGHSPAVDDYEYCLAIPGNNVVQDCNTELLKTIQFEKFDHVVATIGNLNKDYVPTLINEIKKNAVKNSEQSYFYCMIGDSPNLEDMKKIKNSFSSIQNVTVELLGSVYPIPEKLLYKFDLFISSAGSARVSGDRAIPTITIDARDFQSIGVYQYETGNTVFRDNEAAIPISEKMEYVFEHYDEIKSALHKTPQVNFDEVFDKHLNYYLNHVHTGKYYDVMSMKLDKKKKVEKIIYQCLGKKMYDKIRTFVFSKM